MVILLKNTQESTAMSAANSSAAGLPSMSATTAPIGAPQMHAAVTAATKIDSARTLAPPAVPVRAMNT